MSIASNSLKLTGLYEAELLLELMLRFWQHPMADDKEFRTDLLECAASFLRSASQGNSLIEGLPGEKTNLVAAIWYSESAWIHLERAEARSERSAWLSSVRRAIPSCFVDPDDLLVEE